MANDIPLGGTIRPGTVDPVYEDIDGGGGYRSVATIAARNAITVPYRKEGMLVYVQADTTVYQLASDLTTWNPFTPGGGGQNVIYWPATVPWATIYAEILSRGGNSTVILDNAFAGPGPWVIPAGTYVLNGVLFWAPGGFGSINMDSGVTLSDGGAGYVEINLFGVYLNPTDALVPPGTVISLWLDQNAAIWAPVGAIVFPDVADGSALALWSGSAYALGGFPLITLAPAANLYLYIGDERGSLGSGTVGGAGIVNINTPGGGRNNIGTLAGTSVFNTDYGSYPTAMCSTAEFIATVPKGVLGVDPTNFRLKMSHKDGIWHDVPYGTFYWNVGKTWTDLWAEVQAGGGFGTIYVESPSASRNITAGTYDFTNIMFVGLPDSAPGSSGLVVLDPGVLIDGGSKVVLRFDNLVMAASAALMTPGAVKQIVLEIRHGNLSNLAGNVTLFDSAFAGGHSIKIHYGSMTTTANTTNPYINMSVAAASVSLWWTALRENDIGAFTFNGKLAGGVLGTVLVVYAAPFTQQFVNPAAALAPTVFSGLITDSLSLPFRTSAQLAAGLYAPSAQNKGLTAWDTTRSVPKMSTGTKYGVIGLDVPIISWVNPTPWSEIYARIQDADGIAVVLLSDPAGYSIPAGSYDLTGVEFVGENADSNGVQLEYLPGCLLDADATEVGINLRNVVAFASAPLMTADTAKKVRVNLFASSLIGFGAPFTMFRSTAVGVAHVFYLNDSGLRNNSGPVLFINQATSIVQILMFGGQSSLLNDDTFAGTTAGNATYYCDAVNQDQATRPTLLTAPLTFNVGFSLVTNLNFPRIATVDLPAPSAGNKGLVAWDSTTDRPKISDGLVYKNFALTEGTYIWSLGKTWTQLWDEIQKGSGGFGTVYIPSQSLVTITGVGPYNLNNLKFVGLGERSELDFDPGVLVDAGTTIELTFDNLLVFGQAPMMTPGAKEVSIQIVRGLFSNYFGGAALFSTSSTLSSILGTNACIANHGSTPTDAVFDLTAPAARVTVNFLGGGFNPQLSPIFGTNVFIGNAAASVGILADALSMFDVLGGINGPITEALGTQYGRLALPNYTTAQLPAPSTFRKGQVSYDTTEDKGKVATSTTWLALSTDHDPRVSDGVIVANTFVKQSSATDERVVQFLAGDDPFLIVGVALDAAAGAGTTIRVARKSGQKVSILSDGASAIVRGDILDVSTTSNGRVTLGVGGAQVSTARKSVAATVDVLVDITF